MGSGEHYSATDQREEEQRLADKALLRNYHTHGTSLGHEHWGVSEKTWREWVSDDNKKPVPRWVVEFIIGERRYNRSLLGAPGAEEDDKRNSG